MPTGATGQLGLALPVQGELSGTWGDTVNNGITQYTNIAIAGTLSFAGDGAITLANTTGDATASNIGSTTAQYMVIRVTGTLTTTKSITAPSYSKIYLVDNAATGGAVSFLRSGQVTPVTIAAGESAFVYYNGTDYIKVTSDLILGGYTTTATAAGTTTLTAASTQNQFFTGSTTQTVVLPVAATLVLGVTFSIHNNSTGDVTVNSSGGNLVTTVTSNTTITFTCILTSGTSGASWDSDVTGFTTLLPVVHGGTGTSSPALVQGTGVTITGSWPNQTINATGTGGTVTGVNVSGGTTGLTTSGGPVTTSGTITLAGTLGTANGGTNLTSFTANGVVYASSSSALATGSALTFSGTSLGVNGTNANISIDGGGVGGIGNVLGVVGSSYGYVGTNTSTPLVFNTGGTERMRLDTSGNLGIGTSSPSSKLSVNSGSTQTAVNFTSTSTAVFYALVNSGSQIFIGNDSTSGSFVVQTPSGGYSTKLIVDNAGNVGIGTSSPISGYLLTVNGQGAFTGPTSDVDGNGGVRINYGNSSGTVERFLTLNANGTTNAAIGLNMVDSTAGSMTFSTRFGNVLAERFRFGSLGQFGIAGANFGTAGQVLTSAGSSSAPTWAAAGGGSQAFVAFSTTGESVFASQGF